MLDLVEKCARRVGLTGVHWSQFGIKEERQRKMEDHLRYCMGEVIVLISFFLFGFIISEGFMVVCWLSHCL